MSTFVVNFIGVAPPPRYDKTAWTKVLVYESATEAGTFSLLDTVELSGLAGGLDTEPEEPMYRDITITNATVAEGYYYFVFEDGSGNTSAATATIHNAPSVESSIRPSLEDLGAVLRVRTVAALSGGKEEGTFTSKTRPTAREAEDLIDLAVSQTILTVGEDIGPRFWEKAKTVVLYLAACLVELSFYKNEIDKGISAYPAYESMYKAVLEGLINSVQGTTAASPTQSFFSVPILTQQQARLQAIKNATNPETGVIDPAKLPPDMDYPLGPGGFATAVGYMPGSDSFLDES